MGVFAAAICLYYGRLGVLPLDNSIVFDGGWRILSGQKPFVDFTTPVAIVPSVMQAALFGLFGVSWFTFCLHAAIVNALFACVAFAIMRTLGGSFWSSWAVGMGSAVMFYPPCGVPYMDQHSFFFSLCAVWTAALVVTGARFGRAATFWCPTFVALALFSKHIPALFLAVPALVVVAAFSWRNQKAVFAAGLALPAVAIAAYMFAVHAPLHETIFYLIVLPQRAGAERAAVTARLIRIFEGARGLPLRVIWITSGLWLSAVLAWIVRRVIQRRARVPVTPLVLALFALGLTVVTIAFLALTNNDMVNGLALAPLIVGTTWLAARTAAMSVNPPTSSMWSRSIIALGIVVCGISALDLYAFNRGVNATRQVHSVFDWSLPRWSPGGRLAFMVLNDRAHLFDERDALRYIDSRPDNFLLWGDSTFLYGATGHPSVFPALWMHPGLTIPHEDDPEFAVFERRIVKHVREADVKYVLQEGSQTLMAVKLDRFPRVAALIEGCPQSTTGAWTIREICH